MEDDYEDFYEENKEYDFKIWTNQVIILRLGGRFETTTYSSVLELLLSLIYFFLSIGFRTLLLLWSLPPVIGLLIVGRSEWKPFSSNKMILDFSLFRAVPGAFTLFSSGFLNLF